MAPALLLALAGCGLPPNVVVLLPDENGTVGEVAVHEGARTTELDKPFAAVNGASAESLGRVFTAEQSDVNSEFAGALAAAPQAPVIYILYFRTGLTELDPWSQGDLAAAIAAAKQSAYVDISVVGHIGATGSDAYDATLSLKRAQTVRNASIAAGVRVMSSKLHITRLIIRWYRRHVASPSCVTDGSR